jgi:multidrug resistance efflux pump
MSNLTHIELSELFDLLAQQTNRYMKMFSDGFTRQEFDQCRETMIAIQAEIYSRKSKRSQHNQTPSPAFQTLPPRSRSKN